MTLVIPTTEPTQAVAGDTWEWSHVSSRFARGDGWVLAYRIAGPSVVTWDADFAAEDGDGWTITILPTATSNLEAGTYTIWREFTLDDDRRTERAGTLAVSADPKELQAGDAVFWAETALVAVRAAIAGRATSAQMSSMIGSRQVMHYTIEALMKLEAWLTTKVARRRRGGKRKSMYAAFGGNR